MFAKAAVLGSRKWSWTLVALALVALTHLSLTAHAQEQIDPRTGRLLLTVTDLTLRVEPITLQLRRMLDAHARWRSNWESRAVLTPSAVVIEETPHAIAFTRESGMTQYRSNLGERLVVQADGRFVRTMLDGTIETFDANGRLLQRDYRNGNKAIVRYGADSQISRIDGPRGSFIQFSNDAVGRVTRVDTSTGTSVRYGYTGDNLSEVQVDGGPTTRYVYDGNGALTRIDRPGSGAVELVYDARQRVVGRRWADGVEERFEYNDSAHEQRRIDPTGAVTVTRFSPDRRRAEVVEPRGGKIAVAFDSHGRRESVTGPSGETAKVVYDARGRTAALQDRYGQVTRFEYLGESILIKAITPPSGKQRTFEYDPQGNLVAVKAGTETIAAYTYHSDGNVASVVGRGRPRQAFTYHLDGRLKSVTDALGGTSQLEYDSRGNVIRETNALGGVNAWSYDSQERLVSHTDPAGGTRRYEYSPGGNLIGTIDPMGGVTRYTYNARGWLVSEADPIGRVTRYEYYPDGRVKSVTDPAGQTSRFEYAETGDSLRVINPLGAVLTKTYDPSGRLTGLNFPSGATAQYDYSADGLHTKFAGPSGRIIRYRYDDQRRIVGSIRGTDRVTGYEYNVDGMVSKVFPPRGPVLGYEYDDAGRLTATSEDGQGVVRNEYDALGRRTKASYAKGLKISYHYDQNGNLTAWQDNLGASARIEYDGKERPTGITDSFGKTTRYQYDLSGRPISITDPLGNTKRLMYSAAGELIGVVEPSNDKAEYHYTSAGYLENILHPNGGRTTVGYNPTGAPVLVRDALGKEFRMAYDTAGYLRSTTDAKGQTITLAYDLAGRLSRKELPDGKTVSYRYDSAGNLAEVNDGLFPIHYAYDADNRLIKVEYPAIKRTLSYEYDKRNLLSKFVDSEGRIVGYEYDSAKRPTRIILPEAQAITITYDPKDRATSLAYPNGVKAAWSYDAEDRPVSITYTDRKGAAIAGWRYTYDAAGNRVQTVDAQGRGTRFQYDASGRLIEEDAGAGKTVRYGYLPGGNRERREGEGRTDKYRYDQADRLLAAGEEVFTYDANGNLTERRGPNGATRYSYDAEDQLVKVILPDGKELSFGYSPAGERVWRRDSTGLTYFVTDGLNLLAELDESLRPRINYIHGPGIDRPLMMVRDKQAYFYHADVLGSVSSLTDSQGNVVASYDYDAFGAIKKSATLKNPFAFAGREYDDALKIYFNRARYYDPSLGRFLARDPVPGNLFDPLSFNAYAYVKNNPLRYVDPFGTTENPRAIKVTDIDSPVSDKGRYKPSRGILIYPEGRVSPEIRASVIAHETSHHVDWKVEMARQARAGLPNLDFPWKAAEQDAAFEQWIKNPRVVLNTERAALSEEAHTLIEQEPKGGGRLKPNHPVIENEILPYYEQSGGYRDGLKRGLNEYDEWMSQWDDWANKPPGTPTPKVATPVHDGIQKRLDTAKASAGDPPQSRAPSAPEKPSPPGGSSSSDEGFLPRKGGRLAGTAAAAEAEAGAALAAAEGGALARLKGVLPSPGTVAKAGAVAALMPALEAGIAAAQAEPGQRLDAAGDSLRQSGRGLVEAGKTIAECAAAGAVVGGCIAGPPGAFVGAQIGAGGVIVYDTGKALVEIGRTIAKTQEALADFPIGPPLPAGQGVDGRQRSPADGPPPPSATRPLGPFTGPVTEGLPAGPPRETPCPPACADIDLSDIPVDPNAPRLPHWEGFDPRAPGLPRATPEQIARAGKLGGESAGGVPGTTRPPGQSSGQSGQAQPNDYLGGQAGAGVGAPQQPGQFEQMLCPVQDPAGNMIMMPCPPGAFPPGFVGPGFDPRREGGRVPWDSLIRQPGRQPPGGSGVRAGGGGGTAPPGLPPGSGPSIPSSQPPAGGGPAGGGTTPPKPGTPPTTVAQAPGGTSKPATGAQCDAPLCREMSEANCNRTNTSGFVRDCAAVSAGVPSCFGLAPGQRASEAQLKSLTPQKVQAACYQNMLTRCNQGEAGGTGDWCVRKGADSSCAVRAQRVCGG